MTIRIKNLFLFALIIGFVIGEQCQHPWEPTPRPEKWWRERHQDILNITATQADKIKIVFIGSSSVQYWGTTGKDLWDSKYAPLGAVNYGIRRDGTQHVLWRIEHGEFDGLSPKLVVIYVGTWNVPRCTEDDTVRGVNAVIDKLHEKLPNAKLLFIGFFPRANRVPVRDVLTKVRNITNKLQPMLDGDTKRNTHFLDIFSALVNESFDGIKEEYFREDKLHLNRDGYAIWDNLMNNTFYSLIK